MIYVLLVPLIILFSILPAFIGAALNNSAQALTRGQFAARYLGSYVAVAAIGMLLDRLTLVLCLAVIWAVAVGYWAVSRLRDLGVSSRYRAVWTGVPFIGFLYALHLMLSKSTADASPT